MTQLRSIALGTLLTAGVVAPVAAQEVRTTIGPIEKTANRSSPENPIPRRLASASPLQPTELTRINGGGGLRLWVTLDETGSITEIRKFGEPTVIPPPGSSLDDASRRAIADRMLAESVAAIRQWKYEAPGAPIVFVVLVNFAPGRAPTAAQQDVSAAQAAGREIPQPPPSAAGRPSSPPWPEADRAGAVRAGPGVTPPKQTRNARPRYSPEALAARVQGTVRLEILIGTDGKVKDARILASASPLFDESAVDAVRRWEFTPALVNGVPTPIVLMAELDFNLR